MLAIDVKKEIRVGAQNKVVNLQTELELGKCLAIDSPSGTGKSTMLNIIAGFSKPDLGSIKLDSTVWYDYETHINLQVKDRPVGYVLQTPSLFPHQTVSENLSFALPAGKDWKADLPDEFLFYKDPLALLATFYPHQLSGGQAALVTLVRAVLRRPKLLMLDEAFHGLDQELKKQTMNALKAWRLKSLCGIILVSHDSHVRQQMADKVVALT